MTERFFWGELTVAAIGIVVAFLIALLDTYFPKKS